MIPRSPTLYDLWLRDRGHKTTVARQALWVAVALGAILIAAAAARGQEHRHPAQDVPLHETFYSTWMRPDNPKISCCNKADCSPRPARLIDGQWWAQRREDGKWLLIPASKIERNRDSPDGRSHLCAPPPGRGDIVFCFVPGSGS